MSITTKLAAGLAATLVFGLPDPAGAEPSRYEEPIRYRRAVMTMVKRHYDQVAAMAKGTVPFNRNEFGRHAAYLEMLSRASLDGFVPGSHEGETKAKPEIWKEWSRFQGLAERFQSETTRLRDVARGDPPDKLKAAVADLTKVCKTCHDDFKAPAVGG